jgi:hypothetical protein
MPACDICNATPGPDARPISAVRLRVAVETGYRPAAVIEHYRRLTGPLGLDLGDDHWFGEWVEQVRRDQTDWLLCQSCWTGLEGHLDQPGDDQPGNEEPAAEHPAADQPASRPRRRWFGRWRR